MTKTDNCMLFRLKTGCESEQLSATSLIYFIETEIIEKP